MLGPLLLTSPVTVLVAVTTLLVAQSSSRLGRMKESANDLHLRIIHINDVYELDNFPSFFTLVDTESGIADETLVVLAGDFCAPSLLSSLDQGRGMIDILNSCRLTHCCIGNHETDIPMTALADRIRQSNFPWLNTNMRELDTILNVATRKDHLFTISNKAGHSKTVGMIGVLTEDPSLYRPNSFGGAAIEPVLPATQAYMKNHMEMADFWLPLTHQRMPEDREFCNVFGGDIFPIVLGGHDHEVYDETHSGSRIFKTGYDAQKTGIIDIVWSFNGATNSLERKPKVHAKLVSTTSYAPNERIRQRVLGHQQILRELEQSKLFRISDWLLKSKVGEGTFSTHNNRLGPSNGSRVLVTMLRMAMRAQCAVLNAGSIRGNQIYENQEWFSWSDLKAEIPFPTLFTALYLPGKVLEDTIRHSRRFLLRDPPVAFGGYLHACDQIDWNYETKTINTIGGLPFDREREYLVAFPVEFLSGVDQHQPLLDWAAMKQFNLDQLRESGRPSKLILVELFSALVWLEMGSFEALDIDGDGILRRHEIQERAKSVFGADISDYVVDSILSVADLEGKGYITPLDMMVVQFVATDMLDHVVTQEELQVMKLVAEEVLKSGNVDKKVLSHKEMRLVVDNIKKVLDIKRNGKIDREEAIEALGKIRRENILSMVK